MSGELVLVDIVTETEGETGNRPWRRYVINRRFSTFDKAIGAQALELHGHHVWLEWRWKGEFREIVSLKGAE